MSGQSKKIETVKAKALNLPDVLDMLVSAGLVTDENARMLATVARASVSADKHILEVIAERQWDNAANPGHPLSLAVLLEWFAKKFDLNVHHIDPLKVDVPAVTEVMSYAYASRFNILAVAVSADEVIIAISDPYVTDWEPELTRILNKKITRVFCNPADMRKYQLEFYTLAKAVKGAKDKQGGAKVGIENLEQLMELGKHGSLDANDQHVVNIVDWLLQYAFAQRASDIHLEPRREQGNVRFRIDGVMHQVYQIPATVMKAVTSRIKVLARMDVAEKRRPQDGRIKTLMPDGQEIELRLSTMPTAFGEKLVMRIFDPEVLLRDMTELGFTSSDKKRWMEMIEQPNGIVLVTGPTGSGKTTTLYSSLKRLATEEVNVCTIEDPIEQVEPSFNQMQVQRNIDLDFSTGVRTLLRQDPDVIMVGEIRDLETAEMAIQAALTGHLVLSTLHTNDAPTAITRLLELGVPSYLINATVLGVMAQRLLRTLCPHCKEPGEVDAELWASLVAPWKQAAPEKVFHPVGCLECRNTGFLGRIGLYETLQISAEVRSVIKTDLDLERVRKIAVKQGMKPLRIAGAQKVAAGLTTIEEVLKVAPLG
ncbi:MAG: type II/IV secretion system protein [Gammaproteobacteria bacterium]|nr:type II/IV secretion system protein [Gammaproteobacteria bacterium]